MAKAELKTKKTELSVDDFLKSIDDDGRRKDSLEVKKLFDELTSTKPKMWGSAIVGYIDTSLKYPSGRELDWFKVGFSPRKQALTLYLNLGSGFEGQKDLLDKLGKHTTGKGCLYIKKLSDVDIEILKKIIKASIR